jgi:hypothetical protein
VGTVEKNLTTVKQKYVILLYPVFSYMTECGASECVGGALKMRRSWRSGSCSAKKKSSTCFGFIEDIVWLITFLLYGAESFLRS